MKVSTFISHAFPVICTPLPDKIQPVKFTFFRNVLSGPLPGKGGG